MGIFSLEQFITQFSYVSIQSMGNAIDFGDASTTIRNNGALASSTRALSAGGANPSTTNTL